MAIYETLDDRFVPCRSGDRSLEVLHQGTRWAEGPIYVPAGRYLVWSDIPNDRLLRWDETTGQVGVFREPAGYVNGNTLDFQGRLISCEQGNRRVTRTELDGSVTVIAERYMGKRFNSPNDSVATSDGSIWFSDPVYGILSDYEGHRGESEIGERNVYRVTPDGSIEVAAGDFTNPNGLVFSPDESRLYVSDSGANHIRVFDVADDWRLTSDRIFASAAAGNFDNIRLDIDGRLWAAAMTDGVHCYDPDGTLLGRIAVPEVVANICFGGRKRNRMFIAATSSLYSVLMSVTGAPLAVDPRTD
jgi:gluconolactonase